VQRRVARQVEEHAAAKLAADAKMMQLERKLMQKAQLVRRTRSNCAFKFHLMHGAAQKENG
jgi:hypothetical protein